MEALLVLVFTLIIINYSAIKFFSGLNYPSNFKFNDKFNLGYIQLDNKITKLESNKYCDTIPSKEINKLKKQIRILQDRIDEKEKSVKENNKLSNDCISALMALGMKKKSATEEVNKYFITHTVNTVEEFINNFFKDRNDKSHCSD